MPVTNPRPRRRRGASAIEFALVFPMMLVFTFGVMDWSWYLVQYQLVARSAQVGARSGAQTRLENSPGTVASARARTYLEAMSFVPTGSATYTTTLNCLAANNSLIRVAVTVPYAPLVGFVPTPPNVRSSITMRCEEAL